MKNTKIYVLLLTLLTTNILVLSFVEVSAQTTSKMYVVKNSVKFLEGELISRDIRDANGEVCAGLAILSDMEGLSFQAYNGIVKKNSEPGKDFLFLSPTERVVEVYKSGYEPLKIILNDYGIKLKSGTTWQIKITGDKKLDLIPIIIKTDKKDAKIFIDFELKGTDKAQHVAEGSHILHIEKDGYVPIVDSIDVSINNIYFEYKLTKIELVNVQFNSNPTNAKIFINDKEKGKTNLVYKLLPGKYKIKVVKLGYLNFEKEIEVLPTKKNFTFKLIKNLSLLRISVLPKEAKVELNGREYFDIGLIELQPGTYNIAISNNGYRTISESIILEAGMDTTKAYYMQPERGGISFTIKPVSAEIILSKDGKDIQKWNGSKEIQNLPIGQYQLTCKAKNYKTQNINILIEDNQTTTKHIAMEFGISDFAYLDFNVESDYEIFIDDKKDGSTSEYNKQVKTGKHKVELRSKKESIKSVVYIDGSNSEISIGRESKTGIILQSALLPGLGQITHGRATMGGIYMVAFAGAVAYHYMNYKSYNDTKGELEVMMNSYNNNKNPSDKYNLALEINNKQSEVDDAYNKAKTSIWFPIGVYAISLLDAILYPTPKVIKIADNKTLQFVPTLAMQPNGAVNAGVFVRF